MINILMNQYTLNADWCFEAFKPYIKSEQRVLIVALSYNERKVKNYEEWKQRYERPSGAYYQSFVEIFEAFGIKEEQIEILCPFTDTEITAKKKIETADILFFLGGMPDQMYERLERLNCIETLRGHQGTIIGYSAGAVIQFNEYHLSPDEDYAEFGYYQGIGWLNGFEIEVHYTHSQVQQDSIKRFLSERHKPIYAMGDEGAIIVDEEGRKIMVGDVTYFENA